jgi:hypothetical protein
VESTGPDCQSVRYLSYQNYILLTKGAGVLRFMRYIYAIGFRVMRSVWSRLVKVSKENAIGVALLPLTIAYEAHLHTWSRETFLGNMRETVFAPCLLMLCLLFVIHLIQSAWQVYTTHRRSFSSALGTITNIPPWHLQWRLYVVLPANLDSQSLIF